MTCDAFQIFPEPLQPSSHGVNTRIILRFSVRVRDDSVDHAGNDLSFVMLEWLKAFRKHAMDSAAVGIIAAAAGNGQPFRLPTVMAYDALAVVVADQTAGLAFRTNIFPALI